jgi:hypothetical protein
VLRAPGGGGAAARLMLLVAHAETEARARVEADALLAPRGGGKKPRRLPYAVSSALRSVVCSLTPLEARAPAAARSLVTGQDLAPRALRPEDAAWAAGAAATVLSRVIDAALRALRHRCYAPLPLPPPPPPGNERAEEEWLDIVLGFCSGSRKRSASNLGQTTTTMTTMTTMTMMMITTRTRMRRSVRSAARIGAPRR